MIEQYLKCLIRMGLSVHRKGASPEAVEALERACGHVLPQDYRDYLLEFGDDPGAVEFGDDGWTTVAAILGRYADPPAMADTPQDCILVSVGCLSDSLMIDCSGTAADGQIWTFDVDDPQGVSSSFRSLLFQKAWLRAHYVKGRYLHTQAQWSPSVRVSEVEGVLASCGMNRCEFADQFQYCGESSDVWGEVSRYRLATVLNIGSGSAAIRASWVKRCAAVLGEPIHIGGDDAGPP